MAAATLKELLRQRVGPGKEFPSQPALAAALGVAPQTVGRAMTGAPLDVLNCLKLATLLREPASVILRLAGKHEYAALIEHHYGKRPLTPAVRDLIDAWQGLPTDAARAAALAFFQTLASTPGATGAARATTPSTRRSRKR